MDRGFTRKLKGLALVACAGTFAAVSGAAAQGAACEPQNASRNYPAYADKVVKIGVNVAYPPFAYTDAKDMTKIVGLDVEIIESAMTCTGLKFQYIIGPYTGLFPALLSGTLDVVLGNVFYRPDRADKVGFVLYMINGQSLVVRKDNPKAIKSAEDMCGHSAAGTYDGSSALVVQAISAKCVEERKAAIVWTPAPDQESAYRLLDNDRIDMVMDGAPSVALRMRSAVGKNLQVAFTRQSGVKSGIIVPKGNQEMLKAVAEGLADIQATGRLAALMKKYGLEEDWLIPVESYP